MSKKPQNDDKSAFAFEGNYTYNYHPYYDVHKMNGYLKISFDELIESTASIFEEILKEEDNQHNLQKTIFHATKIPAISIQKYLLRIKEYAKCSEDCIVLALIYIDRITESKKGLNPDKFNIHRLIYSL